MNSLKLFVNSSGDSLKCAICRGDIKNNTNIYQSEHNFGIVCSNCYQKFSVKDIEWMMKIFLAYGGYFAKLKEQKFSLERYLRNLSENLIKNEKILDINELNIKFIHEILLHGITIQEYQKKLKSLLK
jgi:hypothetical protein